MSERHAAILQVSRPWLLRCLRQQDNPLIEVDDFPHDVQIVDARYNGFTDWLELCLEGQELPAVLEGGYPPIITPTYRRINPETAKALSLLKWALQYGKFEVAEDNPLHALMLEEAMELVQGVKVTS
jgi:hypothetical protein